MASDIGDGDYLGAYRRFFVDFLDKVNPDDQLPIKTSGHDVIEGELVGEIIHMTLQYLNQQLCPPSLQCYIVQLVIEEIKATCRKQPENCGFRQEEKTYEPLKLMQAVTGKVNEICQRYLENSRLALLPPPPSRPMPLATAYAIRNNRRKMEDRHVILHDLNTIFNIKDDSIASYYAVFDGHAGYQAAVFCATHLHQYLAESRHYPTDPERALREAFITTDERFIKKSSNQTLSSGTTAVCALILNRKLYVAWAGDSQAALAKRGIVTQLVNPHKPDRNDERERVEEMGGTVMHLGIWRVNGNLAVSRAIGDAQYKPYVTGEPEIRCITLDGHEDFLIIGCDGLWDCVTEDEAATLVYQELYRDPYDYKSTSQRLVEYAKSQGSVDNITVIVVFITTPRQIAARSPYGNPLLADVQLNNMEPDNRYLSNPNGQYDVNSTYVKQQTTTNNGSSDMTMNDDYGIYGNKSSNGKRHENGDNVADYNDDDDDLGPETDVDAVDDVAETVTTLSNVSRQLFTEKPEPSEFYQNDECMDEDSPPSSHTTKTNQQALIPESDNVGDSEDSEDEWNYYRIDPNKSKEETAGAAGFSPVPKSESEIVISSSNVENDDDIIEKKSSSQENDTDTSSDTESEREISTNALIDTEISADTKITTKTTDNESETEKGDEEEANKIREEESKGTLEAEEDMDFQLNPNAAEFVPVSPTLAVSTPRIELDVPIAGSPLKQTPTMDDIRIPSRREFQNEIRCRPHEIEDKTNGQTVDDNDENDKPSLDIPTANLDESEVSSTKAEFGDESSFFTASELHRTGISTLDGSFIGSCGDFEDSAIDPMTKSLGPSDFANLSDPVDLNAVHDLTDADLMADEEDTTQEADRNDKNESLTADYELESTKDQTNVEHFTEDPTIDLLEPIVSPSYSSVSEIPSNIENTENHEISRTINDNAETSNVDVSSLGLMSDALNDIKQRLNALKPEDKEKYIFDDNVLCELPASSHVNFENSENNEIPATIINDNAEKSTVDVSSLGLMSDSLNDIKCLNTSKAEGKETYIVDDLCGLSSAPSHVNFDNSVNNEISATIINDNTETSVDVSPSGLMSDSLSDIKCLNASKAEGKETYIVDDLCGQPFAPSHVIPASPEETNVTTKLLAMDLEDRGSQDCEFEKCNEKWQADEEIKENTTKLDEKMDYLSSPMPQVNVVETFSLPESLPIESRMIEETRDIDNLADSFHELRSNDDVTSAANPVAPDVPVLHNPLDLNIETASEFSHENVILEDDGYRADYEISKGPDSPDVSPSVAEQSKYPFDEAAYGVVAQSFTNPHEIDIPETLEDGKSLLDDNPREIENEPANLSDLKLSESLQEFTGLERQLNPQRVSNGLDTKNNLMDICDEETKVPEATMNILSEIIENKIVEGAIIDEVSKPIEESRIEESNIMTPVKEESKIDEPKAEKDATVAVAAIAAAAAAAVGTTTVTAKTMTKAKTTTKPAAKSATTTKTGMNKSTPTSPTKAASSSAARTSSITAVKKAATTTASRPNKLETASGGKTGLAAAPASKSSSATNAKCTLSASKPGGRLSAGATRAKPSSSTLPAKSMSSHVDKKPSSNGDVTKSSLTTTTTSSSRVSSTSSRAPPATTKPPVKSSIGGKTTTSSTTTTTTTATSTRQKTASAASTTRITSKTSSTTGNVGTTTQRPKTAPSVGTTSLVAKTRLGSSAKSPITEKQIKETANKQISSSRTSTTTTASKSSRNSGATSIAATTMSARRLTATKTTSSSSNNNSAQQQAIPPPIRKPSSMNRVTAAKTITTTNGKGNSTKTTSTNKSNVVVENGVCTNDKDTKIVTSTTTTTTTTTTSNEEDVPKKDDSPIEAPTDNQLIINAD